MEASSRFESGFGQKSSVEAVTLSSHVQQKPRRARFGLQLPPKRHDIVVDDSFGHERSRTPNQVQQAIAAQDAAAVPDERAEQLEFERRHLYNRSIPPDFSARKVQFHVAEAVRFLLRDSGRAAPEKIGRASCRERV